MLGAFGPRDPSCRPEEPPRLLHHPGTTTLEEWRGAHGFVQHARFDFAELADTSYAAEGMRCWFCGDLPAHDRVPWDLFIDAIRNDDWQRLGELHVPFAAAVCEEDTGRAWLISDRRSQHPLFYRTRDGGLDFSILVSAFGTSLGGAGFAREWLYEVLYFNHPVLETTYYENVRRLPPASVLHWDPAGSKVRFTRYAAPFARPERFVGGHEGYELAQTVFSAAASDCYRTDHPLAVALTAGFDSRATTTPDGPRCRNRVALRRP